MLRDYIRAPDAFKWGTGLQENANSKHFLLQNVTFNLTCYLVFVSIFLLNVKPIHISLFLGQSAN